MANLTCETGAVVLHGYMGKFHIVQGVFFFHVFFPLFFFFFFCFGFPLLCVCLTVGSLICLSLVWLIMFGVLIYMMMRLPSWCDPIS